MIDSVEEPTGGAPAEFKHAALRRRECYCFKVSKGVLKIIESQEKPSRWDLYLGSELICPNYRDPWQAAADARRSDFGNEELDRLLKYEVISDDLDGWQKCKV